VSPYPSFPEVFAPQHLTEPLTCRAQVCVSPSDCLPELQQSWNALGPGNNTLERIYLGMGEYQKGLAVLRKRVKEHSIFTDGAVKPAYALFQEEIAKPGPLQGTMLSPIVMLSANATRLLISELKT